MTNPTPEQVAAAREWLKQFLGPRFDSHEYLDDIVSLAALLAEREIATLEKAAKLVCPLCQTQDRGVQNLESEEGIYFHDFVATGKQYDCKASQIHAIIAQLKEAK